MITIFGSFFPAGFSGSRYRKWEDYKHEEITQARELINADIIRQAIAEERWAELMICLNGAIDKTNLIFDFQKERLRNLSAEQQPIVGQALLQIVDAGSEDELGEAIAALADALKPDAVNKWSIVSWIANVLSDLSPPLVKPTPIGTAQRVLPFDIEYTAHPSANTWKRINEMYRVVEAGIQAAGLKPRNRLDVYTLMSYGSGMPKRKAEKAR